MMNKIEMTNNEVSELTKRAEIIGQKRFEVSMLERESAYKIMEIVNAHSGDTSSPWRWQGNLLIKQEEKDVEKNA